MFMAHRRKKKGIPKILISLLLIAIIALAITAATYVVVNMYNSQKPRGLHVGDVFTYNMTASSYLITQDAVTPAYLVQYNMTDYYQVSITSVKGDTIGFNTLWQFNNGTAVTDSESINLDTGVSTGGFWAIYLPGLNEGALLNPQANNGLIVNSTSTQTYATSTRTTNNWSTQNILTNANDPTGSTQQDNFWTVNFDEATGMLTSLTNVQEYNNPGLNIAIVWQLTNSTVWQV